MTERFFVRRLSNPRSNGKLKIFARSAERTIYQIQGQTQYLYSFFLFHAFGAVFVSPKIRPTLLNILGTTILRCGECLIMFFF